MQRLDAIKPSAVAQTGGAAPVANQLRLAATEQFRKAFAGNEALRATACDELTDAAQVSAVLLEPLQLPANWMEVSACPCPVNN